MTLTVTRQYLVIIATALACSFCIPLALAEEVLYRWTDERGDPVHSDRPPPPGVDYEVISTRSSLVRSVDSSEGAVPLEVEPRVGNDFEPVKSTTIKIEKNPEYCQRARENLETLSAYARIRVRGDDGEYRYIDEEEKARRRKEAEEAIAQHCE